MDESICRAVLSFAIGTLENFFRTQVLTVVVRCCLQGGILLMRPKSDSILAISALVLGLLLPSSCTRAVSSSDESLSAKATVRKPSEMTDGLPGYEIIDQRLVVRAPLAAFPAEAILTVSSFPAVEGFVVSQEKFLGTPVVFQATRLDEVPYYRHEILQDIEFCLPYVPSTHDATQLAALQVRDPNSDQESLHAFPPSQLTATVILDRDYVCFKDRAPHAGFVLINADDIPTDAAVNPCLENWVLVPGNASYGVADFCVMKYEAKLSHTDQGNQGSNGYNGSWEPESRPSGTPWVYINRDQAIDRCRALGDEYDLISNSQWQTIAQNIELAQDGGGAHLNWQNGSPDGNNFVNEGATHEIAAPLAAGSDHEPCAGTATNCLDGTTLDFRYKRTHSLSNGEVIWDVGGNVREWVNDYSGEFSYSGDTYLASIGSGDGADCQAPSCTGPQGRPKQAFGPHGDYPIKGVAAFYGGLGFGYLSYASNNAIVRGGHHIDGCGDFSCPSFAYSGIFSVSINGNIDKYPHWGFRCVASPQ